MVQFVYNPPSFNDLSSLTPGWHPAFLLDIEDIETPLHFKSHEKYPRSRRWRLAVWETDLLIDQQVTPERQSALSSSAFAPAYTRNDGQHVQAAKAYKWTEALLGRQIVPGEVIDLSAMLPLACRVEVERKNEYANITAISRYPELASKLTLGLRQYLAEFLGTFGDQTNQAPRYQSPPVAQAPTPAPTPPVQSGMQSWGTPAPRTPTSPASPAAPNTPRW